MSHISTHGINKYKFDYEISNDIIINIYIYDNAGQENYRTLNKSYYSKVDSCILVYDITSKTSFENCQYYNEVIKENCKKNIKVLLLGNKSDNENQREVSEKEGMDYAISNSYIFYETSCLKNENVSEAFETLIKITEMEISYNNFDLKRDYVHKRKKNC